MFLKLLPTTFFILTSIYAYCQDFNYLPTSTTNQIVKHAYYTLSYSEKHEQAEWIAYEIKSNLFNKSIARTEDFRQDPLIKTGSAGLSDYKGSGYHRGHLAPAGSMKYNFISMSESFFLSNISPQDPSFNLGVWKKLETQVRNWAEIYGSIYVVTGPVFLNNRGSIGINQVTVPGYYYKAILDYKDSKAKAIAFLIPNQKGLKQLNEYAISIDSLESISNIDFFPNLEDKLEDSLESKIYFSSWSFNTTSYREVNNTTNSSQCQGVTQKGVRCKNMTTNQNGYCHMHQSQINNSNTAKNRSATSLQCTGTTKKGLRCKLRTYCTNQRCHHHGGNCY
jgi:endonuclease G, mitochondrial